MKTVEIMDDFLSVHDFEHIRNNTLYSNEFPLYYVNGVALYSGFVHGFYINGRKSQWCDLLFPLFAKLEINQLLRAKLNFYPKTQFLRKNHNWHIDNPSNHKGCILFLNTCNGETHIKNKPFDFKIKSIENRMLFFKSHQKHHSTTCTDQDARINVNFIYF